MCLRTKNVVHIDVKYSGSVPFLVVETEDGKSYQVKAPNIYSRAMLKEFISNQLAKGIGDIVPEGVFLSFATTEKQLIPMLNAIKKYSEKYSEERYDFIIENLKNNDEIILFGVEWLSQNVMKIEDDENLFDMLDNCCTDNFYSLFPLDLVLVNRDRHTGNILFFTNETGMIEMYLIDHDRIFSSKKDILEQFYIIKEDFDCLKHYENDQYKLFDYIDEQNKKEKIMIFANKIQQIKKEDIKNFLKIFKETCPPDILEYDDAIESISSFISHRCNKIKEACNNNLFGGECYA